MKPKTSMGMAKYNCWIACFFFEKQIDSSDSIRFSKMRIRNGNERLLNSDCCQSHKGQMTRTMARACQPSISESNGGMKETPNVIDQFSFEFSRLNQANLGDGNGFVSMNAAVATAAAWLQPWHDLNIYVFWYKRHDLVTNRIVFAWSSDGSELRQSEIIWICFSSVQHFARCSGGSVS